MNIKKIIFLYVLLNLTFAQDYYGLEEVEVRYLQGTTERSFHGVITIIPHTNSIILWQCKNKSLITLQELFPEDNLPLQFTSHKQGLVIPFQYFNGEMKIEKNQYTYYHVTLSTQTEQLILSFQSMISRLYSYQLIEHLKRYTQFTESQSEEKYSLGMTGMDEYLDGFCLRVSKKQHDDL